MLWLTSTSARKACSLTGAAGDEEEADRLPDALVDEHVRKERLLGHRRRRRRQRADRRGLRQIDLQNANLRHVAESAFGAALVAQFELQFHRIGCRPRDRQRRQETVEVDLHLAEVLVGLHLALGQGEATGLCTVAQRAYGDLVLVQVEAGLDAKADFDRVAVHGKYLGNEYFVNGREVRVAAEAAEAGRFPERQLRLRCGHRAQCDRFRPDLRRVAEADVVVAALALDDELGCRRSFAADRVRDLDGEAVAIDLLAAEELVLVIEAAGQNGFAETPRRRAALEAEPALVKVSVLVQRPVDLEGVARIGHGVAKCLLDGNEVVVGLCRG